MNCTGLIVTALAAAALLASSGAGAQPHGSLMPEESDEVGEVVVDIAARRATKLAEMDVWLRRLVGRFRYEGIVDLHGRGGPEDQETVQGLGDCIDFGVGPGVHCVINVKWPERWTQMGKPEGPLGISNLDPAMILYGIDPDKLGIRYMQGDNKGLPEGGLGIVKGDMATFKTACVNTPGGGCQRIIRIRAMPDNKSIDMWIDVEQLYDKVAGIMLSLRRVPQDDPAGEALKSLPAHL